MKQVILTLLLLISVFSISIKAQESSVSVTGEVRACELTVKLIPEIKYNSNLYVVTDLNGVEVFRFESPTDDNGVAKIDFCNLGYNLKAGTYTIFLQQESGAKQYFYNQNLFNSYSTVVTLNIDQSSNIVLFLCCCCCCLLLILLLVLFFLRRKQNEDKKQKIKENRTFGKPLETQ